jgi:hypothetical protein
MEKTAAILATTAVAGAALISAAPAQAMEIEREKVKRCSGATFAALSLEKEFNRIDVDFELENATPGRSWNVRIKHNANTVLRTQRVADYEGELDVMQQVSDRPGKDRFIARATGPNGEVCRVKLGI